MLNSHTPFSRPPTSSTKRATAPESLSSILGGVSKGGYETTAIIGTKMDVDTDRGCHRAWRQIAPFLVSPSWLPMAGKRPVPCHSPPTAHSTIWYVMTPQHASSVPPVFLSQWVDRLGQLPPSSRFSTTISLSSLRRRLELGRMYSTYKLPRIS